MGQETVNGSEMVPARRTGTNVYFCIFFVMFSLAGGAGGAV